MAEGADADHEPSRPPRPHVLTVGRRTYRKRSRSDRRYTLTYTHPELRLSNAWLSASGIKIGDRVAVTVPKDGYIVISRMPAATPAGAGAGETPKGSNSVTRDNVRAGKGP